MSIDFRALRTLGAALLLGVSGFTAAGCGDDPVPAPPPRYAPITVFNAVSDVNAPVQFKVGETVVASSVTYGTPIVASQALVGSATQIKVLASTGTELGSTNANIDTNRSVWVIVAGEALSQNTSVFAVSHSEPTVPNGSALIRAIHASHNAPKIDVRQENALGSQIATGITYKGSGEFTSVSPGVSKLSITKNEGDKAQILEVALNPPLQAGRIYNLVIYGSADPNAVGDSRLTAKVLEEPA
jgi:hypothetical protein